LRKSFDAGSQFFVLLGVEKQNETTRTMKKSLPCLLLALLVLATACKSDEALESILSLEAELEESPNPEKAQRLLQLYQEYVENHPDAHEENAELLYKGAALSLRLNQPVTSVQFLETALRNHYAGSRTPENALLLADVYADALKQPELAQVVYRLSAEAFPGHKKLEGIRDSLMQASPELSVQLDSLKFNMYDERSGRIDARLGERYTRFCLMHALILPEHTNTPVFLYEGAKIAGYVRSFPKAIELYELLYERYPTHERASQALFMLAYTYDSELGDTSKARPLYLSFLEKYPESDFADDAEFLLDKLGLSDEEIIQRFENQALPQ
jgi:tetratricopeptide (TPR) repeat protein